MFRAIRQFFSFLLSAAFLALCLVILLQTSPASTAGWIVMMVATLFVIGMTFWLYRFLMGAQFDPLYMHDHVTDDFSPGVGLGSSVRRRDGDTDSDDLI